MSASTCPEGKHSLELCLSIAFDRFTLVATYSAVSMFSGGASTPVAAGKRPHTRASAAARRSQSRAGSLAPSNAGTPVPTRRAAGKSSGLAGRALTASYAGSELGGSEQQQEDVDGLQSQGVLLKTESHAVSLLGVGLPAEVQHVLNNSGELARCCEGVGRKKLKVAPRLLHGSILGSTGPRERLRLPGWSRAMLRLVSVAGPLAPLPCGIFQLTRSIRPRQHRLRLAIPSQYLRLLLHPCLLQPRSSRPCHSSPSSRKAVQAASQVSC